MQLIYSSTNILSIHRYLAFVGGLTKFIGADGHVQKKCDQSVTLEVKIKHSAIGLIFIPDLSTVLPVYKTV